MIKKIFFLIICLAVFSSPSLAAMTLKESIDFAVQNYPGVLAAKKKVEAAEAKVSQAVGAFLPTLKLNGNYGRAYTAPSVVQLSLGGVATDMAFGIDASSTGKGLSANFSQPIFVAALFPGLKIAQKGLDMAKEDYRKAVLETTFNVTVAYYRFLAAQKYIEFCDDSLEMAVSHQRQVELLLKAGVVTKADLLRVEVQRSNSEVALTKARNALLLSKSAFNNALGRDIDAEVSLDSSTAAILPQSPDEKQLLLLAFKHKVEWKQFLLNKEIAENNLLIAYSAYLPTVLISGQTGSQATNYPSPYPSNNTNSWSVAGSASWTFFDGMGMYNRVREAAANLDSTKVSEKQLKDNIIFDVRSALLDIKTALEAIGSSKKSVAFAEESYNVSTARYNAGVGTSLEEIDSQVALTQARVNLLQTFYDLQVAKAKLNKIIGMEVI